MLVYELMTRCGNYIDEYRFIKPDNRYEVFTSSTRVPERFTLSDVKRFQIEKTAGVITMEVVL